jgi:tetratricopeptide (TPR) repeat protein
LEAQLIQPKLMVLLFAAVAATPLLCSGAGLRAGEPAGRALSMPAHRLPPGPHCPVRSVDFSPEQYQIEIREDFDEGKLDALETRLAQLRKSYAASECSDRPFSVIFAALLDGAPAMQRKFDNWVAGKPGSPYALTARGLHYVGRAAYVRGQDWASETTETRFAAMNRFLARAEADFNAALKLDPTFADAMVGILTSKTMGSDVASRIEAYNRFVSNAPHSYVLDSEMLADLVPRWGGSFPMLQQFAEQRTAKAGTYTDEGLLTSRANCLAADELTTFGDTANAASVLAKGMSSAQGMDPYCYFAKGQLSRKSHDYEQAQAAFANYRMRIGPVNHISKEADSWVRMHQYGAAINLFTMGMQFKSASPSLFCGRAESYLGLGDIAKARRDVAVGLSTDPGEPYCLRIEQRIIKHAANKGDGGN